MAVMAITVIMYREFCFCHHAASYVSTAYKAYNDVLFLGCYTVTAGDVADVSEVNIASILDAHPKRRQDRPKSHGVTAQPS